MRKKRRDIFRDGELATTVIMPRAIYDGSFPAKENWARKELAYYITQFHGPQFDSLGPRWQVDCCVNRSNGRVTGIQATIRNGEEETFYMVVEPVNQPGRDGKYWIQIHKAVYNPQKEGDIVDEMVYVSTSSRFSCGLFEAARMKKA